jgi:hypothetical protein
VSTWTTLYLSMASMFVAEAAGVHMTLGQQLVMMLTLMPTSKGVGGVPRAALVILAGTPTAFHLPVEGSAILLGVDAVLDMARTSGQCAGKLPGQHRGGTLGRLQGWLRANRALTPVEYAGSEVFLKIISSSTDKVKQERRSRPLESLGERCNG